MPPVEEGYRPAAWRSLGELEGSEEFRRFVAAEFPSEAPKLLDRVSRRRFLEVMGASLALLSLTGCRWPEEEIVPFAHRPEDVTPGVPKRFATAMEIGGFGFPLLVTSFDGRPIKVDGNPEHPQSRGGSDAITQASVLELYDPDRSRGPRLRDGRGEGPRSWKEFEAFASPHFRDLRARGGEGLRVLSEATRSPSLLAMRGRFEKAFPGAVWHEHEPFSRGAEREGLRTATGTPLRAIPRLEKADVILCLDDDLLGDHPAAVRNTRELAAGRRAEDGRMNRLRVVEPALTVTGGMADHRVPLRSGEIPGFARKLLEEVRQGEPARPEARDLLAHRGRSLVTAGPEQPPVVHRIAFLLNHHLGNVGRTVEYVPDERGGEDLASLVAAIGEGRVGTLLILGGNPAFDGPAEAGFGEALAEVEASIHLSLFRDETSELCTWHVNRAHWLESWGDARAFDGSLLTVQPLLRPLYGGRTPVELLALLLGEETRKGHEIVRRTWRGILDGGDFERRWRRAVHDGFLAGSAAAPVTPAVAAGEVGGEVPGGGPPRELLVRRDLKILDGRFANNAWLQELPDPVTKLTWDNAALLSPALAGELGVADGDHLRIAARNRSLTIPALSVPGQAPGTVLLPAGYGRRRGGRVAAGAGVDVYPVRGAEAFEIEKVPGRSLLALTQNHHAIGATARRAVEERSRGLVREATLSEYRRDPAFAAGAHRPPLASLFGEHEYAGRRWAMSIDLSACTGCSACVVACQAENNVPVVGKEEVARGREMHWLRVDRYFRGDPASPSVAHQPVPCMQCENAPCEQVCPVAATVHSAEGLNDMVYNRCVGTRYCSNNCPYKVRRFNWFRNHRGLTDIQKMVMNPEVTVRSRGVMEKCTYCVQRISAARIAAKREGRPVRDGEVVPACAQACPAEAIAFGDLADPGSRILRLHEHPRSYAILEELNVRPRTRYLARLRNPGPEEG